MRNPSLHLATWILSRLAPENERDPLIGDLAEEYALRSKATSSSAARKWYLRQVCASVPPLLRARLRRPMWLATFGFALAAYIAIGVVQLIVGWVIADIYDPLNLIIGLPMVVLIGYVAARFRRRAATVLAALMLVAVTVMTLTTTEAAPLWYRIAFFLGPAAAFIGGAVHSRQERRSTATRFR
jgi:hypothetical protein